MTIQTQDTAGTCPFTIERPIMRQRWERLTFLHWPFEPADVQRLLPKGLDVETYDGAAWVALVPFFMRVATPGERRVPWASNFCETNVRTYVRDGAGRSGIWFFSLDAAGSARSPPRGPRRTGCLTSGHRCGSACAAPASATFPRAAGQARAWPPAGSGSRSGGGSLPATSASSSIS